MHAACSLESVIINFIIENRCVGRREEEEVVRVNKMQSLGKEAQQMHKANLKVFIRCTNGL